MWFFVLIFSFISLNNSYNFRYEVIKPQKDRLIPCANYAPAGIEELTKYEFGSKVNIHFNRYGFPRLISNFEIRAPGRNNLEKAYNFLSEFENILGINPRELSLIKELKENGYSHITYQQRINGIPVEGAVLGIHVNPKGNVYYISSDYFPYNGAELNSKPSISANEALNVALSDLAMENPPKDQKIELVYYPYENSLILTYKVRFFSEYPLGEWLYYIDAENGNIIERRNELKTVYGYVHGWLFPNSGADALAKYPMKNQYVYIGNTRVTTNASGYYSTSATGTVKGYLKGPYVGVYNDDVGEAEFQSSGGITYTVQNITYAWTTTSDPTGLTGDDQTKLFSLPFEFPFYGKTYTSVYVCTNGFLSFTSNSNRYYNDPIPNSNAPNAMIAPFWRDLNPAAGGGSITYYSGPDKFIITWDNIKNYRNTNRQTFQVILYPDGTIDFVYATITSESFSTTIGVEDESGGTGVTVPFPTNYTAYRLVPQATGGGATGEVSWEWKFPSDYSDEGKHTDEVMVFYHVNYIHDYHKSFGFNGMDYQIKATVFSHSVDQNYSGANAYYYNGTMEFGRGNASYGINDMARSADVIYHEYTHGVTDKVYENAGGLPYRDQSGAMNEAWSDYFACTQNGSPVMGEWVMPPRYQRNLQNDNKYPDDYVGEVHEDSKIYSGALWDFRTWTNKTVADRVTWRAYFYYPKDFLAGRDAMIQADKDLYNGAHVDVIKKAFARHGIGDAGGGYEIKEVSYGWISTSTPTGITGDDQTKKFYLPFSFPFYGSSYSSVYVCSNGWLSFTSNYTTFSPQKLPNTNKPNAVVAPFWRDLYPGDTTGGALISYSSSYTRFIVTWYNIKNYSNSNRQTFQVILYRDGKIRFNYQSITDEYVTTVGIENANGTEAALYAYGSGNVLPSSYSSIEFIPVDQGISVTSYGKLPNSERLKILGTNKEVYKIIKNKDKNLMLYDVSGRKIPLGRSGIYFIKFSDTKNKRLNKIIILK